MDAPQFLHRRNQNQNAAAGSSGGKAAVAVRIALVGVLAGLAFVDFVTPHDGTADQPPADPAARADVSIRGSTNDAGAQTQMQMQTQTQTQSTSEYYLPSHYASQSRANEGNVVTYEHD